MAVVGWRVYYDGGRQYTSARSAWRDIPDDGVLVMKLYYDEWATATIRYTLMLSGHDHYFHIPDTDVFGANDDPTADIVDRYDGLIDADIKRGKWTDRETMEHTQDRAFDAPCPG